MKVCCDRCEKPIRVSVFNDLIGGEVLIARKFLLPDKKISLCDNCYQEFRNFLNGGVSNDD